MQVVTGILVYVMLWWLIFFMSLPWGYKSLKDPNPGSVQSSPEHPHLLLKAVITTLLAAGIFFLLYLFVPADPTQWGIYKD